MKTWTSFLSGIGSALVMGLLVFGSLAISLVGNGIPVGQAKNLLSDTSLPIAILADEAAMDGSSLNPPDAQAVFPPPPVDCLPPTGWHPITVSAGESLTSIAQLYAISRQRLMEANCMEVASVEAGAILYVPDLPPTPTATSTPTLTATEDPHSARATKAPGDSQACGRPAGWVVYIVRSGDTLFKISQLTRTTVSALQRANCLGSTTLIHPGDSLYVPFQPVVTVYPTRPAYESPTPTVIPTQVATTPPPPPTEPSPPTSEPTDPPPTEPPTEPPPDTPNP